MEEDGGGGGGGGEEEEEEESIRVKIVEKPSASGYHPAAFDKCWKWRECKNIYRQV